MACPGRLVSQYSDSLLAVSREKVIDLATGREPQANDRGQNIRDVVVALAVAFNTQKLPVPPVPQAGLMYEPTYLTATELRNVTDLDLSVRRFAAVLRDELRLNSHDRKGYEILDVFGAVERIVDQWNAEQHER